MRCQGLQAHANENKTAIREMWSGSGEVHAEIHNIGVVSEIVQVERQEAKMRDEALRMGRQQNTGAMGLSASEVRPIVSLEGTSNLLGDVHASFLGLGEERGEGDLNAVNLLKRLSAGLVVELAE